MKTGTIVLIPFPFSELTDVKVRPAVVIGITRDKYKDVILAAVTSQIPKAISVNDIPIYPDFTNGLRVNSIIKVDRICTLKREKVIATLGDIGASATAKFMNVFKLLIDD